MCGCCELLVFKVCGVRQNFYVFSLYRNPNLDDRIYECFPTLMAAVKAEDVRTLFLFVGDLNAMHHQEWLGLLSRTVMVLRSSILQLYTI